MNNDGNRKLKADLVLMGISQARIAGELGVHPSMVSKVLSGKKTSRRVLDHITVLLGVGSVQKTGCHKDEAA